MYFFFLQLIHQHVIDTSLLYRREFGWRFRLKVLTERVLKWVLVSFFCFLLISSPAHSSITFVYSLPRRQIQTEEEKGHNSTEDAVAALELAQYFIKTGPRQVGNGFLKTRTHALNKQSLSFYWLSGCGASSGRAVGIRTRGVLWGHVCNTKSQVRGLHLQEVLTEQAVLTVL